MTTTTNAATKQRLLSAATELFAAHGFKGTTMRQLAERGEVNLAASHYHVGSKRDLYFEVLRSQFAEIRTELERRGAAMPREGLSRKQILALLRRRIRVIVERLIGPPPSLHGFLMQREMCDPSEALPLIVDEFVAPNFEELYRLLRGLAPDLSDEDIELCAFSIVGQILFYHNAMPAVLYLKKRKSYPRNFSLQLADHILEFSLGGLLRVAGNQKKGRVSRGR